MTSSGVASPAVRALAAKSQKLGSWAFVVMLLGAFIAMSGFRSDGFVVAEVTPVGGLILAAGLAMAAGAHWQTSQARREGHLAPQDNVLSLLNPGALAVAPPAGASLVGVAGVVMLGVVLLFTLPVVVAARTLHATGTATVGTFEPGDDCARCHRNAVVSFEADGRTVRATLAAARFKDEAPFTVVYDTARPSRVMAASDYAFGRSITPVNRIFGSLLVCMASFGWATVLWTRRRALFSGGRPTVPIRSIALMTPSRGRPSWQVVFADGKKANYLDWPAQRAELLRRIEADPHHFQPTKTVRALLAPNVPVPSAPQ